MTNDLSKIACPILYMASTENPFHTYASAQKTAAQFDKNYLTAEFVENTGLLQFDAPNYLQEKIAEFISQ